MKKLFIILISLLSSSMVFSQEKINGKDVVKTQKDNGSTTILSFDSKKDYFKKMFSISNAKLPKTRYYAKNKYQRTVYFHLSLKGKFIRMM